MPPEVGTAALVVPASLLRAEEAERGLGFEPIDVSSEDRGDDIESRNPAIGRLRFIEVKGRRADAAHRLDHPATRCRPPSTRRIRSFSSSCRWKGEFIDHPPCLPNPAPVFGPEPEFNEVSRAIAADAIKRAARSGWGKDWKRCRG